MYNLNANASIFRVGTPVKTGSCAGIDSNKEATVCNHFSTEGYNNYLKADRKWIPIQFKNGDKTYFPASYLNLCK